MEAVSPFVLPALLVLGFYLLIIRPARNKARATTQMQDRLAPGLEVMTTSGLFATVDSIEDAAVVLEVSPGVTMRFAKAAVARIVSTDEAADDTAEAADDADAADAPLAESSTDDRPESDQPSR